MMATIVAKNGNERRGEEEKRKRGEECHHPRFRF